MKIDDDTTNKPENLSYSDLFVIKDVEDTEYPYTGENARRELIGDTCIFCKPQKDWGCDKPILLVDLSNQEGLNSREISFLDDKEFREYNIDKILKSVGITDWRIVDYDFNIFDKEK